MKSQLKIGYEKNTWCITFSSIFMKMNIQNDRKITNNVNY